MSFQKPDIVDTAIREGCDLKKSGRYYKGLCPRHSEKHPSFIADPQRQTAHCFGCGWHCSDVISFIQDLKGLSFKEALSYLGLDGQPYKSDPKEKKKRELLQRFRAWCDDYFDEKEREMLMTHKDLKDKIEALEPPKKTKKKMGFLRDKNSTS